MKTIVIKIQVPEDTDIFDVHDDLEARFNCEPDTLCVYESVSTFMTDHREV